MSAGAWARPGGLLDAQVLDVVPLQPADLVQRVVLVTSPARLLLLAAAADLIDDLDAELDDVVDAARLGGSVTGVDVLAAQPALHP